MQALQCGADLNSSPKNVKRKELGLKNFLTHQLHPGLTQILVTLPIPAPVQIVFDVNVLEIFTALLQREAYI